MKDDTKTRHWWLYILKLEDERFYVGITSKTPEIRFQEHLNGVRTAYWTAKHKPIELIHKEDLGNTTKASAEKRENKMTRACMKKLGINNVRGGDLTSTEDYVIRFGYFFSRDGWDDALHIILALLLLFALAIDKFFIPFIPFGVR